MYGKQGACKLDLMHALENELNRLTHVLHIKQKKSKKA